MAAYSEGNHPTRASICFGATWGPPSCALSAVSGRQPRAWRTFPDRLVDGDLRKSDRGCSAVAAPGSGLLTTEHDRPFPPGRVGRLNNLILYAFVLHELKTSSGTESCCPAPKRRR
jgi:hypothetical protein